MQCCAPKALPKPSAPLLPSGHIDLELQRGEVLGLVGDNGAGKSTFVKILRVSTGRTRGRSSSREKRCGSGPFKEARCPWHRDRLPGPRPCPQLPVYLNLFLNREHTSLGKPALAVQAENAPPGQAISRRYQGEHPQHRCRGRKSFRRAAPGHRRGQGDSATGQDPLLLDEPLAAMGAKESAMIIDLVKDSSRTAKKR